MENVTATALPSIVHPTTFNIAGHLVKVATYFPIDDRQAAKIAMQAYRSKKWAKKDRGKKVTLVPWLGDRESLALLG